METKRVLVTVKTYPSPSRSYQELVCTAGVLEDGAFIRLYPVDYRYRPIHQWYDKYQWVDVAVERNPKDPRPESYRPNLDSIRPVGEPLSSKNGWAERKKFVLARPPQTMCALRAAYDRDKTSLGIVRPERVTELRVKSVTRAWKSSQESALAQINLIDAQEKKPLQKIPYKFSYRFFCEGGCQGHTMRVTDWELGRLYLREVLRLGSEEKAVRSVQAKFLDEICGPDKDTHFFVGTTLPYNSWIVLGAFYPKKDTAPPKQAAAPSPQGQVVMDF